METAYLVILLKFSNLRVMLNLLSLKPTSPPADLTLVAIIWVMKLKPLQELVYLPRAHLPAHKPEAISQTWEEGLNIAYGDKYERDDPAFLTSGSGGLHFFFKNTHCCL